MKKLIRITFTLLLLLGAFLNVNSQQQIQLEKAKKIAEQFLAAEQIPGMAISISKNGALILSEGFGFMDV